MAFFSNLTFAKTHGYTILEWGDYIQKEFTKADLKDGMVVERRDRSRLLVIGDRFVNGLEFNAIKGYENDLKKIQPKIRKFDIVKIFRVKNNLVRSLEEIFEDSSLELIWERKEIREMTVDEMRQKLEELTGESIDVIEN